MNCEEIRDLIPAYVAGTATAEEAIAVEDHIASCDLHEDVLTTAATVALIGSTADEMPHSASLKARVMAHAENTLERRSPAPVSGPAGRSSRTWLFRNPVAALLVVAVGVMAVWNIMLQGADSPERFVHYYWGNDNDWMRIETVLGAEGGAEVSLGGVERLDDSRRYHLWTTRGEDVLLVGAFNVNPEGKWAGEFEFVFEEGDRVWMTSEIASGVEEPTGEVVLRTRF